MVSELKFVSIFISFLTRWGIGFFTSTQAASDAEAGKIVAQQLAEKYFDAQQAESEALVALEGIKDMAEISKELVTKTSRVIVVKRLEDAKKATEVAQAAAMKAKVAALQAQLAADVAKVIYLFI